MLTTTHVKVSLLPRPATAQVELWPRDLALSLLASTPTFGPLQGDIRGEIDKQQRDLVLMHMYSG